MTGSSAVHRPVSRLLALVLGAAVAGAAAVALAQQPNYAADKAARQQELDTLQAEQRKAADAEALIKGEIAALGEDRRKLNDALLTNAGRLRLAENHIAATEARLKKLADNERTIRKSLDDRRAVIIEVLPAPAARHHHRARGRANVGADRDAARCRAAGNARRGRRARCRPP